MSSYTHKCRRGNPRSLRDRLLGSTRHLAPKCVCQQSDCHAAAHRAQAGDCRGRDLLLVLVLCGAAGGRLQEALRRGRRREVRLHLPGSRRRARHQCSRSAAWRDDLWRIGRAYPAHGHLQLGRLADARHGRLQRGPPLRLLPDAGASAIHRLARVCAPPSFTGRRSRMHGPPTFHAGAGQVW